MGDETPNPSYQPGNAFFHVVRCGEYPGLRASANEVSEHAEIDEGVCSVAPASNAGQLRTMLFS